MSTTNAAEEIDSKYFIRTVTYSMLKEQVVLHERGRPQMTTVDEWPQLVFLSADGKHTVADFIAAVSRQYSGGAPKGLPEQTRQVIRDVAAHGYIVLMSKPQKLPYYLSMPIEQQDPVRSKQLMEADGFITKVPK
ncbi:hypothetical protein F9K33_16530 [bacterium]|nr:MAG: hypothetical protein F9K33_16530 [bacterium]